MSSKFELFLQFKANLGSHLPVVMLKSRDVSSILNVDIASGKKPIVIKAFVKIIMSTPTQLFMFMDISDG